jgi:CBS domain-containing protein
MKTCSAVMTREVIYCLPDETVDRVARLMKDNDIGPIPIVQDVNSKKLVGMVTDRDLVVRVLAEGRDAQHTRVEEVMTGEPIACRESDSLDKALNAMANHQVRRIPVVNNNNQLVGIIAQADIATRGETPFKTAEVVEEISKPDTSSAGA